MMICQDLIVEAQRAPWQPARRSRKSPLQEIAAAGRALARAISERRVRHKRPGRIEERDGGYTPYRRRGPKRSHRFSCGRGPQLRPVRLGNAAKGPSTACRYGCSRTSGRNLLRPSKRSTPASCHTPSEGKHAGRRKTIRDCKPIGRHNRKRAEIGRPLMSLNSAFPGYQRCCCARTIRATTYMKARESVSTAFPIPASANAIVWL
jgi:hypothetical protein